MTFLLTAQLVFLVGAALCLLPMPNRWRVAAGLASQVVGTVLVLTVSLPVLLAGAAPIDAQLAWAYPVGDIRIRLDALGAFFLCWSLPMTALGAVYAVGYLRKFLDSTRHVGVHFALLNLTSLSFVLIYSADQALVFLLGWEIAALAAWLLVIWDYANQKVRFAGFNYLVSTHIGLIFLVAAFMVLYAQVGSWDLQMFGEWLRVHEGEERAAVFLLLLASFALKSAFFPFHSWLPRAHAAAPAHVSALMSGVIHKAGLYGLVRFLWLMERPEEWMGWLLIGFSLLSALIGALYTVGQRDLKRLLGYSSTENVGIAGIGFGVGCLGMAWGNDPLAIIGFTGGLLHVLNHAFFKCLLFYAAGAVYQGAHTVDIERLGGLARLMPWTTALFLVGGVAICGLPPLNGFASEFLIYSGLYAQQPITSGARVALALTAAGLAFVGAVSGLSMARSFGIAFLGSARDPEIAPPREAGAWMRVPMLAHAAGVVLLGVAPGAGLALVGPAAQLAGRTPLAGAVALGEVGNTLAQIGALAAGLLVVLGAALWLRARTAAHYPPREHVTWGCGYPAVSARMQYTGSSFGWDFMERFQSLLALRRRRKAPRGYFPQDAALNTDCVDAVEQRLFSVIHHGDETASGLSRRLREDDSRPAFGAALFALVVIAALVVFSGGPLP